MHGGESKKFILLIKKERRKSILKCSLNKEVFKNHFFLLFLRGKGKQPQEHKESYFRIFLFQLFSFDIYTHRKRIFRIFLYIIDSGCYTFNNLIK